MCLIDRPQLASRSWSNLRLKSKVLHCLNVSWKIEMVLEVSWYNIVNYKCQLSDYDKQSVYHRLKLNTSWSRCQVSSKKPDQNSYSPSSSFLYNNADNTNNNRYEHHWKVLIHATINRTDTSLISIYYHQTRSIP